MISFCTLDKLHERQRDPDERVRQEVVITICDAAAENISGVSDQVILSLQYKTKLYVSKFRQYLCVYSFFIIIFIASQ